MEAVPRLLNGLLMLAVPLALGAVLAHRLRAPWGLYASGAAGFFAAQILHIPFNLALLNPALERAGLVPGSGFPGELLGPIVLGLSAGTFEEPARYLVYRLGSRAGRSWSGGLMLGAGHGGLEAILLGVMVLYGFFQAVAYRGAELGELLAPEQVAAAEANLSVYWSAPPHTALLGAVERLLALCVHLGLSILVLQAVRRRNPLWLLLAIGWHALVDAAALLALAAWGAWAAEGVIAVLAAVSLGVAYGLRHPAEPAAASNASKPAPGVPPAAGLRWERGEGIGPSPAAPIGERSRLADSRYLDE